jgi:glycosyltransferase involved in cell wall biosynthesis
VVSDASSLPEVVGDSGLRVPPGDTGALAQAMRDLLREPARASELGARGVERAGRFRWDRAAQEMEEVFREAIFR